MRRRKLLVELAAPTIATVAVALVLRPRLDPANQIARANFDRIGVGMAKAEAYSILGPPGDYTRQPTLPVFNRPPEMDGATELWYSDDYIIGLGFDKSCSVRERPEYEAVVLPANSIQVGLWRLERQWHR